MIVKNYEELSIRERCKNMSFIADGRKRNLGVNLKGHNKSGAPRSDVSKAKYIT